MNLSSRHRGRVGALTAILAVGGILAAWMMDSSPDPRRSAEKPLPYTISKETTWITEPLRPDGAVDYVAALNAHLSEGVTPENNAAVLLMQVMGSGVIEPEIREEYYEHLGVPVPETTEGALQSYWDFLGAHLEANEDRSGNEKRRQELSEKSFETYGRPWTREEFPLVAKWLDENEQAIDLIVAASQRPKLFVPIVPKSKENGLLTYATMEFNSNMREFARILSSRFMFSIGDGRIEEAQRDLLALHRLASLMGSGSSVIDYLVGLALNAIACEGDLVLAQSEHVTAKQLAEHREALAEMPRFVPVSEMLDLTERYEFLDFVRTLEMGSRKPEEIQINPAADIGEFVDWPQAKIWKRYPGLELDWNLILKIGNLRFDQAVAALKQPTLSEKWAELGKIESEVMKLREKALDPRQLELLAAGLKPAREVISRQFGHELAWMFIDDMPMHIAMEVRHDMRRKITIIALALAQYKLEHGQFPAELSELVPAYLESIPTDGFTEEPLKYEGKPDSYLLYSVGPNRKDDKGILKFNADDVAVRVPSAPGS